MGTEPSPGIRSPFHPKGETLSPKRQCIPPNPLFLLHANCREVESRVSAAKGGGRPTVKPLSRHDHMPSLLSLNWEPEMKDFCVLMAEGIGLGFGMCTVQSSCVNE